MFSVVNPKQETAKSARHSESLLGVVVSGLVNSSAKVGQTDKKQIVLHRVPGARAKLVLLKQSRAQVSLVQPKKQPKGGGTEEKVH